MNKIQTKHTQNLGIYRGGSSSANSSYKIRLNTSPSSQNFQSLTTVPLTSKDKLHPPHVEYVDENVWKTHISFQNPSSTSSSQAPVYSSLDALCEDELSRRYPDHQLITGVKAFFKNHFRNLWRAVVGEKSFYQELTKKEVAKLKRQIAFSCVNRSNLLCEPSIDNPSLQQLNNPSLLKTLHKFAKNSPLNGRSFQHKDRTIHLDQAIACSSDRKVENSGNLRVVQDKDAKSICYTGRVDSEKKVLEQASFIFFNELKTSESGITRTIDAEGHIVYQLDYNVTSMLSAPWIYNAESLIAPFPERAYIENEFKALKHFKNQGPVTLVDPDNPQLKCQVKLNPLFFTRSFNFYCSLEEWLPSFVTGKSYAQRRSREGFEELKALTEKYLQRPHLDSDTRERVQKALQELTVHQKKYHLQPEEEFLLRDYLCKLLNIPIVYHCKSSTDRTSIAVALSSALKQWIDLRLSLPQNLSEIIKDFRFKELFALNWTCGHQITRYARGAKGVVNGEKLNNKNLGLALSRGIMQNPIIHRLVPERYLTEFSDAQTLKLGFGYLLALPLLIPLLYVPCLLIGSVKRIFKKQDAPTESLLAMPFKLIFNFLSMIPTRVLNEDSVQVGARHLIAGGKSGGKKDNDK